MLNKLFHGPVGFHAGVRANAALNFGLLAIALLLMKPKPNMVSRNQGSLLRELFVFMSDPPYVFMVMGYVVTFRTCARSSWFPHSLVLISMGFYFPPFFLQLNAIKNGLAPAFAFYTVCASLSSLHCNNNHPKLVILNGSSIVGRAFPNIFAASVGVFTMMVPAVGICGVLIFCTAAIKDVAGTVAFAVLYGFSSGACTSISCFFVTHNLPRIDAGLLAPMVGSLAKEDSEIGSRIGISFTFAGKTSSLKIAFQVLTKYRRIWCARW